MSEALERGDFGPVAILAHNMRGSGGAYGFPAITDMGAGLEQAAESADAEASRGGLGALSRYLDRAQLHSG